MSGGGSGSSPALLALPIVGLVMAITAIAAPVSLPLVDPPQAACEAVNANVVDGDTLHVQYLHLPWGVCLRNETIRADYDAWETSRNRFGTATTDAEIANGKKATADLKALLSRGKLLLLEHPQRRDVYGRLLAKLYVLEGSGDAINVRSYMADRGHLRK